MQAKVLTVLLVDDDAGDRKHLRRLIRGAPTPFVLAEATSPSEAESFSGTPDCIILDHLMPGGTGLDSLAALRKRWPRAAVVMATGQGDEAIAKDAIRGGAIDYIAKSQITVEAMERIITHGIELATTRSRLEEQRQELEHFAHTLAHDLRAPIRAMEFLADCIVEDIAANEMGEVRRGGDDLKKVSGRASSLIASLTEYICLDRPADFTRFPAAEAVQGALANLALELRDRNAVVQVGDLPAIQGSLAQITQLFQNLVANAIKFCTHGAPRVEISAGQDAEGSWVFSVRDNGIGISPEHREKIFGAFRRLHRAEDFAGTGLGLSTCAKIAARHGGRIWCDGAPGGGTVFHVTLPGIAPP